jgi:hypothetical protein
MFLGPDKWLVFAGEVMERVSNGGVILNSYSHISCYAKKGIDIVEVLVK